MRELARHLANKNDLLLYAAGLIALLLSFYLVSLPGGDATQTLIGRAARVFEALGYTLIITTLVTTVLHYSFTTALHERFQIVRGAEGAQVTRIFSNRAAAMAEINVGIQRASSSVDVLCISGTDVLQPNTAVLNEIGRRCSARSNLKVRILLLDPRSRSAVERSLREVGSKGSADQSGSIQLSGY